MLKTFIAAIALSFASVSFADFSGNWAGQGMLQDGAGNQAACTELSFSFVQNATSFSVQKGHYACGPVTFDVDPVTMTIQGNVVSIDGQVVGQIQGDNLVLQIQDAESTSYYQLNIVNGVLTFAQFVQMNDGNTLAVQGQLQRR